MCAATVHAFLVKIPEPLTRTLDWLAGGLEREDVKTTWVTVNRPLVDFHYPLALSISVNFHLTRCPLASCCNHLQQLIHP